ncbi:MAG: hypothetical protein II189_01875, partial [Lachnospiraceae bacterium]|nr:hypothetical protein [Lachnospiraceae bacterium]
MTIEKKDIEQYLLEVKEAVNCGRYRIDLHQKRQANLDLFVNYIIDEEKAKDILLDLNVLDFSNRL